MRLSKKIIHIIFSLLILAHIFSCNRDEDTATTVIKGRFSAHSDEYVYLEEIKVHDVIMLDSMKANDKGDFKFMLKQKQDGFYLVKTTKDDSYLVLQLNRGEKVEVDSDSAVFLNGYSVAGSPGSVLLLDFEVFMVKQKVRIDSLYNVFIREQYQPDFLDVKSQLDSIYQVIVDNQKAYIREFIEEHPSSLTTLMVVNRKLGRAEILDEDEDFEYFHKLDSALMIRYPDNDHALDNHERVEKIRLRKFDRFEAEKKMQIGMKAPNIVMKDTADNFVSLRDIVFNGNDYVVIYFWAGWNAKSRQDNKTLVSLYNEFRKYKIEIFGVSLDENKKVWIGAIKLDKLPWIQGSDMLALNSPVMKAYNLSGELPFYYIVDKKREIVYKDKDLNKIIRKLKELY
jgi:peroxiredoxin